MNFYKKRIEALKHEVLQLKSENDELLAKCYEREHVAALYQEKAHQYYLSTDAAYVYELKGKLDRIEKDNIHLNKMLNFSNKQNAINMKGLIKWQCCNRRDTVPEKNDKVLLYYHGELYIAIFIGVFLIIDANEESLVFDVCNMANYRLIIKGFDNTVFWSKIPIIPKDI